MWISEHEQRSLESFRNKFSYLHRWLDTYARNGMLPLGLHRRILHNACGIELAVKIFGEEVRGPAEQHVLDDLGRIPLDWRDFRPVPPASAAFKIEAEAARLFSQLYKK